MSNSNQTVDAETRAGVMQLLGEYCTLLDHGQFADTAALFVDDGQLVLGERTFDGRSAVERFFVRAPRGVHLCGVPSLTPKGSTVQAISAFQFVDVATGSQVVGYYDDDIVFAGGRCRFAVRRIEMHQLPR
jgi:hypothetical protein